MLNLSLKKFRQNHKNGKNQILYISHKADGDKQIENLTNNLLYKKNTFIFESVEKGRIKGRYTIFGADPDKIWEFNKGRCYESSSKKTKLVKGSPKSNIDKIIKSFKFNIPKHLPQISSIISGYFSLYNSIACDKTESFAPSTYTDNFFLLHISRTSK